MKTPEGTTAMNKHATFERQTSLGTVIRGRVEPVGDDEVRILEYYRKPRHSSQFRRFKREEGVVIPFAQLGVDESFEDFFNLSEAA